MQEGSSRALMNIDSKWLTAHQRWHIMLARWGKNLKDYCCHWYSWDSKQFESVLWGITPSIRNSTKRANRNSEFWITLLHLPSSEDLITCLLSPILAYVATWSWIVGVARATRRIEVRSWDGRWSYHGCASSASDGVPCSTIYYLMGWWSRWEQMKPKELESSMEMELW